MLHIWGVLFSNAQSTSCGWSVFSFTFWSVLTPGCVWTWNRLVWSTGLALTEVIEKLPVNFTNVLIPGVLVYWHLNTQHSAVQKLGPTAGVGIYIGPADAICPFGHQVFTFDGSVLSTPFMVPDLSVFPFDQGLRQMLAQISTSTLDALSKDLEPSSLILDDGVDANNLIGAEVYKKSLQMAGTMVV